MLQLIIKLLLLLLVLSKLSLIDHDLTLEDLVSLHESQDDVFQFVEPLLLPAFIENLIGNTPIIVGIALKIFNRKQFTIRSSTSINLSFG
jgi:hypothetical protein